MNGCVMLTGPIMSENASGACLCGNITFDRFVSWYPSSDFVERGFCGHYGSSLFRHRQEGESIGIMTDTSSQPTGLTSSRHIFVPEDDCYVIDDDLPGHADYGPLGE